MLKKVTLIVLLLLMKYMALADVFVVTSNADSGPGTLREALILAAANGNASRDFINFNLPDLSVAGRTIMPLSNLPDITSDVVIDGATQPGISLSKNGAKVAIKITYKTPATCFNIKSVNYVEIDGLVLTGMYKIWSDYDYESRAIYIEGSNKDIIIGQPGKGNVIYDFTQAISTGNISGIDKGGIDNITLKNNYIAVKEDGIAIADYTRIQCNLYYASKMIFGGDDPAEGNVIYGGIVGWPALQSELIKKPIIIKIKNNIIGANTLQQRSPDPKASTGYESFYLHFSIDVNLKHPFPSDIDVSDNTIGCTATFQGFQQANMKVQHNFWGTSANGLNKIPIQGGALYLLQLRGNILIGGADASKANVFANCLQDTLTNRGYPTVWVEDFGSYLDPAYKVELSRNSFYCNNNSPFAYALAQDKKPLQPLSVDNLTATEVSGTAVPNARVELFYTDIDCKQCQPKSYITAVNADASGKWSYSGALIQNLGVMASATVNGLTSEFTDTRIFQDAGGIVLTHADCLVGGSIKGLRVVNAKTLQWIDDDTHKIVGNAIDLINAPPGKYRLKADQFGCAAYSGVFTIYNMAPSVSDEFMTLNQPSCGKGGAIAGLQTNNVDKLFWSDAAGNTISNILNASDLPAGSYTLHLTGNGCTETYGPVVLKNATGPSVDQTSAIIQSTNCGQTTGSITGITATGTGTIKYVWKNAAQQIVATTADLTDKAAGQYRLEVTDETQCGPIYTTVLTIPETNGITLNDAGAAIASSSCNTDNGAIKGITVTGATAYKWVNAGNVTVSTTVDLLNAPAGTYTFTASNSFGCMQTRNYTIGAQALTQYPVYLETINAACSGMANGSVTVNVDNKVVSMRWQNSAGANMSTTTTAGDLASGNYRFYVTDVNGCETLYKTYAVSAIAPITITPNTAMIINDICGTKKGSIKNIQATGGAGNNYSFEWANSANAIIGNTANIDNLAAGTYSLRVYDAGSCEQARATYTIVNETSNPPAPVVPDVEMCSSGQVIVAVSNPSAHYQYKLYDSPLSTTPLMVQTNGKFALNVNSARDYYISSAFGTCESVRAKVHIGLSVSALNIPNTFTPNNDGINDFWQISGLSGNTTAIVQIFNRAGAKVFESKGYPVPFDGRSNGKSLPVGTYYYVINPGQGCKLFSGTLTIIR